MSDNVGLSTPRGSGTSGYVQRNLAHLRPREQNAPYPKETETVRHRQRQPDKAILEHDRKREVEVKVFELRDRLEEEGLDDQEIDVQCEALRSKLLAEMARGGGGGGPKRHLKSHQVHELAEAKIKETERLRKALGISKDYEDGGHWKKQEERMRKAVGEEDGPPAPTARAEPVGEDVVMDRERDEPDRVDPREVARGPRGEPSRIDPREIARGPRGEPSRMAPRDVARGARGLDERDRERQRGDSRRYRERERDGGRGRERSYSRSRSGSPRSRGSSWSRSRSRTRSRSRSRSEGYGRRRD